MSLKPEILSSQSSEIYPSSTGEVPVLIWIADKTGTIQFVEGEIQEFVDLKLKKSIGKSFRDIFRDFAVVIEGAEKAIQGEGSKLVSSIGSRLWEWQFIPRRGRRKSEQGVVALVFDQSSHQDPWQKGALMDVAATLRKAKTHVEMPSVIAKELRRLLDADRIYLVLETTREGKYEIYYSWEKDGDNEDLSDRISSILIDPGQISRLRSAPDAMDRKSPRLRSAGIEGFPLISGDRVLGVLWVGRKIPYTSAESSLMRGIAEMAASAFQRSRQHELTQRRLDHMDALHAIDKAISGSLDLNLTLFVILEQVVSHLGVDAADVFLFDQKTGEATYAEGRGFQHYSPWAGAIQAKDSLVWQVLQRRDLVAIPDLLKESPTLFRGKMFAVEGFRSYYGIPLVAKGKIVGVLETFHRHPLEVDPEWIDFLRALGTQAAIAMDNALLVEDLRRSNLMLDLAYNSTLEGWVKALDLRDKTTGNHTQRVVDRTLKLAKAVDIPEQKLIHIRRGALLHDIGKLVVPDSILNKEGPLTKEERAMIEQHPIYAREMLEPIDFLRPALPIPYGHHEKWDGSGYPNGIGGNEIPLAARVFALIDVWDALGSPRPYRDAWSEDKIHAYIREQSGIHFDPRIVEIWERVFEIKSKD